MVQLHHWQGGFVCTGEQLRVCTDKHALHVVAIKLPWQGQSRSHYSDIAHTSELQSASRLCAPWGLCSGACPAM
jgi:hypothetical protein